MVTKKFSLVHKKTPVHWNCVKSLGLFTLKKPARPAGFLQFYGYPHFFQSGTPGPKNRQK
jgi:hypothetical protein